MCVDRGFEGESQDHLELKVFNWHPLRPSKTVSHHCHLCCSYTDSALVEVERKKKNEFTATLRELFLSKFSCGNQERRTYLLFLLIYLFLNSSELNETHKMEISVIVSVLRSCITSRNCSEQLGLLVHSFSYQFSKLTSC